MLTLNIPDADASLEARLREKASANGHSIEEEARRIIDAALPARQAEAKASRNIVDEIHDLFAPFGDVELDIPARRGISREPPTFD